MQNDPRRKLPLAVVTMCYNESIMLSIWFKYYSSQVGDSNCYVIDHGSTDGSVERFLGRAQVVKIPRYGHDDGQRAAIVSRFCGALLQAYERVLYVDSDEIIVADPNWYVSLVDFVGRVKAPVLSMFGMDLVHDFEHEKPINLNRPILEQRSWVRANPFLCKPLLISQEITWWNGFHEHHGGHQFDNIYLFHLALFDRDITASRQQKRNASTPIDGGGSHHAISPSEFISHILQEFLGRSRRDDADIWSGSLHREMFLDTLFEPGAKREESHMIDRTPAAELWRVPERFRSIF